MNFISRLESFFSNFFLGFVDVFEQFSAILAGFFDALLAALGA